MAYFDYLSGVAWKGPGQELVPRSTWSSFPPGLGRELARRLGDMASNAAFTYCGLYHADAPYFGGHEAQELPWIWDWFEVVSHGSESAIRLQEGIDQRFFEEVEQKWSQICSVRDELIESEGGDPDMVGVIDVLDYLFSSDLTGSKKDAIQSLCVVILASVNDGLSRLKSLDFDNAAFFMSNAYQALFHIQAACQPFVSGQARGGRERHLKDPKAKDKELVYECWQDWEKNPSRYASVAMFARDVLDKTNHLAGDPQVIARWVRQWRREGQAGK